MSRNLQDLVDESFALSESLTKSEVGDLSRFKDSFMNLSYSLCDSVEDNPELTLDQITQKVEQLKNKDGVIHKSSVLDVYTLITRACDILSRDPDENPGIHIPHAEQLLGALVVRDGNFAEVATGEGKTLIGAYASISNALAGRKVHVHTSNASLAERDRNILDRLYSVFGLSSSNIGAHTRGFAAQRDAFACDIIHGVTSEFAFAWMNDKFSESVGVSLDYAIVDEADSILIDDAITPMLVQAGNGLTSQYARSDIVKRLVYARDAIKSLSVLDNTTLKTSLDVLDNDVVFDPLSGGFSFSSHAFEVIANMFDIASDEIFEEGSDVYHLARNAVKAHLLEKDKDYVVVDDEFLREKCGYLSPVKGPQIVLTDNRNTDKLQPGRRFQDGLMQAIEAKHLDVVRVINERSCHNSISVQRFFKLYGSIAGFSGTLLNVSRELKEFYDSDVFGIPRHLPDIACRYASVISTSQDSKFKNIVDHVMSFYDFETKAQVLEDEFSEAAKSSNLAGKQRSWLESRAGIVGEYKESDVVKPILINTDSAKEAQDLAELLINKFEDSGFSPNIQVFHDQLSREERSRVLEQAGQVSTITVSDKNAGRGEDIKPSDESLRYGGLSVIVMGSYSPRVERQGSGRAARQGDPGSSIVFRSLDDSLFKHSNQRELRKLMKSFPSSGESVELTVEEVFQDKSGYAGFGSDQITFWLSFDEARGLFGVDHSDDDLKKFLGEYDWNIPIVRELNGVSRYFALKGLKFGVNPEDVQGSINGNKFGSLIGVLHNRAEGHFYEQRFNLAKSDGVVEQFRDLHFTRRGNLSSLEPNNYLPSGFRPPYHLQVELDSPMNVELFDCVGDYMWLLHKWSDRVKGVEYDDLEGGVVMQPTSVTNDDRLAEIRRMNDHVSELGVSLPRIDALLNEDYETLLELGVPGKLATKIRAYLVGATESDINPEMVLLKYYKVLLEGDQDISGDLADVEDLLIDAVKSSYAKLEGLYGCDTSNFVTNLTRHHYDVSFQAWIENLNENPKLRLQLDKQGSVSDKFKLEVACSYHQVCSASAYNVLFDLTYEASNISEKKEALKPYKKFL